VVIQSEEFAAGGVEPTNPLSFFYPPRMSLMTPLLARLISPTRKIPPQIPPPSSASDCACTLPKRRFRRPHGTVPGRTLRAGVPRQTPFPVSLKFVQPRSQNPFNLHLTSSSSVIAEQDGTAGKKHYFTCLLTIIFAQNKKHNSKNPQNKKSSGYNCTQKQKTAFSLSKNQNTKENAPWKDCSFSFACR
jgi:hypothetical protein